MPGRDHKLSGHRSGEGCCSVVLELTPSIDAIRASAKSNDFAFQEEVEVDRTGRGRMIHPPKSIALALTVSSLPCSRLSVINSKIAALDSDGCGRSQTLSCWSRIDNVQRRTPRQSSMSTFVPHEETERSAATSRRMILPILKWAINLVISTLRSQLRIILLLSKTSPITDCPTWR